MRPINNTPASVDERPPSVLQIAGLLSARQRQTLAMMIRGFSQKQIANALLIGRHSVRVDVAALYRRYGVNSRTELVALFVPQKPSRRQASEVRSC